MSQVRRLAVALLAVTAFASAACSDSDTVMALTIAPDRAPVIATVRVTLTPTGKSPTVEDLPAAQPGQGQTSNPSFYKRYTLNGVSQLHVKAEGFVTGSNTPVETGEIDVTLDEGEAKAATVSMTAPVTPTPDAGVETDASDAGDAGTNAEASTPVPDGATQPDAQPTPDGGSVNEASLTDTLSGEPVARDSGSPAQEASADAPADVHTTDAQDGAAE